MGTQGTPDQRVQNVSHFIVLYFNSFSRNIFFLFLLYVKINPSLSLICLSKRAEVDISFGCIGSNNSFCFTF